MLGPPELKKTPEMVKKPSGKSSMVLIQKYRLILHFMNVFRPC